MIVTEQEAKTKWCPEVRTGLTAGMAVNFHIGSRRDSPHAGDVHEETRCIGSGCMMWRWYAWHDRENCQVVTVPLRGYCGKAGQP